MKAVTLALILWCGSACAQWTDQQRALSAIYMTAHAIDWGQTRRIAQEPQHWSELNPVLGRKPKLSRVNAYFLLSPVVGYLVLDALPSDTRTHALQFLTAIEIGTVARNHYLGIRMAF